MSDPAGVNRAAEAEAFDDAFLALPLEAFDPPALGEALARIGS